MYRRRFCWKRWRFFLAAQVKVRKVRCVPFSISSKRWRPSGACSVGVQPLRLANTHMASEAKEALMTGLQPPDSP